MSVSQTSSETHTRAIPDLKIVGGLLATSGEWVAYHVTILFAVLFLTQSFFLPETLYPREAVVLSESGQLQSLPVDIPRTLQLGYLVSYRSPSKIFKAKVILQSVKKVPGVPHPKP